MDPGLSPSGRAQRLLPGPTSPASHGPSILGSTICRRFQPMNKSQLGPLVQIKHTGAMMADWLIGEVHREQIPTNSRCELVLAPEERDHAKASPRG